MEVPLYQVDAFTGDVFGGNPAAVCPLERWLDDGRLQAIAAENNLSETAFFQAAPEGAARRLRWFTPRTEVDLCGHATLASAWVVFERVDPGAEVVRFETRSGPLAVERRPDGLLALDLPARPPEPVEPPRALVEGLGVEPREVLAGRRDYLVVVEDEEAVRRLRPDPRRLRALDRLGIIVTAPGASCDFVSRFFAPALGVEEDPVTGSAHCSLVPYWARRLGRHALHARQVSDRGGELFCEDRGERVRVAGRAVLYLEGTIHLPD